MNVGKTLFAQVMDFLPWKTFHRIVDRYQGDHRARTLTCAGQSAVWRLRSSPTATVCATSRRAFRRKRRSSITWGFASPSATTIVLATLNFSSAPSS